MAVRNQELWQMKTMTWMKIGVVGLTMTACAESPLTDRVEKLEAKVGELEAGQGQQQQELLARLDRIPATVENSAELAEVRAKLAQAGISSSEFQALRRRVEALESLVFNWDGVVSRYQRSVYTVIHHVWHEDADIEEMLTFIGTGFAAGNAAIVTNGHIVEALLDYDDQIEAFNARWKVDLNSDWLLVQNLTNTLRYKYNYYRVGRWRIHEEWDEEDPFSPDLALLSPSEGAISPYNTMPLATSRTARSLRVGTPIGTLGFPGELQVSDLSDVYPVATFKNGTVSAIRMPDEGSRYSVGGAYVVQHNLDLSGGTSGSPIFTAEGEVVAVNNSGIERTALSFGGGPVRVSQASLGFGIRADKIHELLSQGVPTAKPAGARTPGARLDGRAFGDLQVGSPGDDLTGRLMERHGP